MAVPKKTEPGRKPYTTDVSTPGARTSSVRYEDGSVRVVDRASGGRVAPAEGHVDKGGVVSKKSMAPGGGGRFQAFVDRLVAEGKSQSSAKAIAASAGRKKYGAAQMARFSAQGRKH